MQHVVICSKMVFVWPHYCSRAETFNRLVATQANAAAFEACCKERIRQFDDTEEEEDIWEEKEINYATQAKSRTRFT